MLSDSETTCWRLAVALFLALVQLADKVLQRYARKLRAPALTCVQDDMSIFEIAI